MWLRAANIDCVHGFSTRHGGISSGAFSSLNLGGSQDEATNIQQNRSSALKSLDIHFSQVSFLKQVHGTTVCEALPGQQEGDALVSNKNNIALVVSVADCYPVLFHDKKNAVIGAAHAGWRGTVGKICDKVIAEMIKLGAELPHISAAIGQGICMKNFEVGHEVLAAFSAQGFPENCWQGRQLDLAACNRYVIEQAGVSSQNIWTMNRCTFESDFFSYRRDKTITGRMWGLIMQK